MILVVVLNLCCLPITIFAYTYQGVNENWDVRVEDLVSRLSLSEIQTQLSSGSGVAPAINHLGIKSYAWWTNCGRGDVGRNATGFPQMIGLGATFDTNLVFRIAEASSKEVRAYYNYFKQHNKTLGVHKALSCFTPNVNAFRDPRWGRGQETFGEDPYLVGEMGYIHVKGLHGQHPRYIRTSSGCKHLLTSGGKDFLQANSQDLRSYFLPPFRRCIEAGAYSVICSYYDINRVPSCANKMLLTDILRDEWNFNGYVAADLGLVMNLVKKRHYYKSKMDAAVGCLKAGCNLEVETNKDRAYMTLEDAVRQGKISEQFLRDQIKPMFYTRMRLGEFDPHDMNPYNSLDRSRDVLTKEHVDLALEAAMKSFVLLKNRENFLPIKRRLQKIAVIGPMADNKDQLTGDYAASTDERLIETPLDGLRKLSGHVTYASGCNDPQCNQYNSNSVLEATKDVDVIFICLGGGTDIETEGKDRNDIGLPGKQQDLLRDVINHVSSGQTSLIGKRETSPHIVLLLFNGGPIEITWALNNDHVTSILECFLPHQRTGEAVYKIITNDGPNSVPSGKLPYTIPMSQTQISSLTSNRLSGFTYMYLRGDPLFPFGYGLSYTTWRYSNLQHDTKISAGQNLKGSVVVHNTGNVDAEEVVQVYLSQSTSAGNAPKHQLVAFGRLSVTRGQHKIFYFTVSHKNLAVWTDTNGWEIKPAAMTIHVGGQQPNQKRRVSSNVEHGTFTIHGTVVLGRF